MFTISEVVLNKVYCSYLYVQTILEIFPPKPKSRVVPSGYAYGYIIYGYYVFLRGYAVFGISAEKIPSFF